jgi:hypothetical protein
MDQKQEQKIREQCESLEQMLETLQRVKGEAYASRVAVIYYIGLCAMLGRASSQPTVDMALRASVAAMRSWGIDPASPESASIQKDATALIEKSIVRWG